MKIPKIVVCLVVTCFFVCNTVSGQQPAEPASHAGLPRIVTVSFNAAVMQTAEAKREFSTLQAGFAPRQSKLQGLEREVDALRKQLADTSVLLSDPEKEAKGQALAAKEKELQREGEDYRADADSASQQAFQKVAQKVYAFLGEFARQHGFSLVVERGSETAPVVWYASSDADITDSVVKAYDAKGTASVPAAASPH
jgi:outer membrane protein